MPLTSNENVVICNDFKFGCKNFQSARVKIYGTIGRILLVLKSK